MKTKSSVLASVLAWLAAFLSIAPFVYVLALSFLPASGGVTFHYYYQVFLGTSQYLTRFWKSLLICLCVVAGQLVVSILAGYGFAKCQFKGKNALLFLLMILMVLPLQVTLAPNYIMLDSLGLLDTYAALILPSIFAPLGTFILTQSFKSVSEDIVDAAKLDGCGLFRLLVKVVLPMNTPFPPAGKGGSAHEHQRTGVRHPALLFGRLEYGGAAHRLFKRLYALSHFRGSGLRAPRGPHITAGVLRFSGAAAAVPVHVL